MRRNMPIFYSALLLTGVNLLLRTVSTSFQVYLSGRIGAAGIGLLQLVLSVGAMALTAGMAGVRTATMYLTAEELGHKRKGNVTWVLSGCVGYSILCSGAIGLLLQFFAPTLAGSWIGDSRTENTIRLLGVFLPVHCLCGVMTGYFTAANRIRTLAAVEVAEQLLYMAVTLTALEHLAGDDPVKACQCVVLGSGISACLTLACLVILRLLERPGTNPRIAVSRRLLRIAVPLGFADDLKAGISTTENLIVPKRLALYNAATDPLAAFGMVCGMVFPILMFPAAILFGLNELLIPELARCNAAGSRNRIQYLAKRSLRVAMLYGCLCGGLEFLLADHLCLRLYSSIEAAKYLRWFAILIPMLYCDMVTDAMTKGLGQQNACVRYNILTSLMDVVFLYILLPHYGMGGYFSSFLITHLLNFLLSLRRLSKITELPLSLSTAAATGIATIVCLYLCSFPEQILIRCIAFPLAFFAVLTLFGVLKKEDLRWVSSLIRR